jgi:hypothetical protein
MKARILIFVCLIALFLSGCIVYSFYPLYTEKDLFPNEILTGQWIDKDSTIWIFEHSYTGDKIPQNIDRTGYTLTTKEKDEDQPSKNTFDVKVIKLEGHYFLDFYLTNYNSDKVDLASFHIIPVHTFAKLAIENDSLQFNWFDQDWLEKLIKQNKIRIHHENNGEIILLTAKPEELQKFVIKYVNSEEAFKDGLDIKLVRK